MGFVLSNYKLGYYDVHLLIDYEDNLKAIHLLGIEPHISMIAKEIQSTNVFCGIPVIVSALNNQYSPASITMICIKIIKFLFISWLIFNAMLQTFLLEIDNKCL